MLNVDLPHKEVVIGKQFVMIFAQFCIFLHLLFSIIMARG